MSFARYLAIESICLDLDLEYEIDTTGLSAREVEKNGLQFISQGTLFQFSIKKYPGYFFTSI